MNPLDRALMPLMNGGAANSALDAVMPRITNLHQLKLFLLLVLVVCALILWKGSRRAQIGVLCAILAVGLSDVAAARVLKKIVPRDRPCHVARAGGAVAFPGVRLAPETECPGSSSFPSNHASNMMALAGVGWWFTRGRVRWLWFLLPLVIGYSRVYLGFHYPTDVLAGWLLGALLATLVISLVGKRVKPETPVTDETSADEAPQPSTLDT